MSANILDHLTAFIAVAETGSFSVAARNLNRAVSSISYSVTQLEAQCGFPLLERRAKRSELTERGRALFGEAKAVVDGARRFSSHAASLERGAETRIQIAVDVVFPLADLHAALKSFVTTHERVQLQLFTSSLNNLWDELRSRSFDFALSLVAAIPLEHGGVLVQTDHAWPDRLSKPPARPAQAATVAVGPAARTPNLLCRVACTLRLSGLGGCSA